MLKAIYPGSFDPVTFGHLDIMKRSSKIVDRLIVGVLNNNAKMPLFSVAERVKMLKEVSAGFDNIEIVPFDGLLIDFAKKMEAELIIRGLRAITDFEYELQIAQTNRVLSEGQLDTMFLTTSLEYAYVSSSTVKEIAMFKGDISMCVPDFVRDMMYEKYGH